MDDRPTIRALVAFVSPAFGIVGEGPDEKLRDQIPREDVWPKVVSLEEAVDYQRAGFFVVVDPADERDLATWERNHRWTRDFYKR